MKFVHSATVRDLSETEAHKALQALKKVLGGPQDLHVFAQDGFWHVCTAELIGVELLPVLGLLQGMGYMEVLVISREL